MAFEHDSLTQHLLELFNTLFESQDEGLQNVLYECISFLIRIRFEGIERVRLYLNLEVVCSSFQE